MDKSIKILKALALGIPIKFPGDGYIYRLNDGKLYIMAWDDDQDDSDDQGDPAYPIGTDHMLFNYFIDQCEQFTDDDLFSLSYTVVRREMSIERGVHADEVSGYWKRAAGDWKNHMREDWEKDL